MMTAFLTILFFAIISGWAGGSLYGHQWFKFKWMPEALFSIGIGAAVLTALHPHINDLWAFGAFVLSSAWAYAFKQSGTWMFLRWEKHEDPNTQRSSTLKPVIDFIASKFGFTLGDEGYAWIAAAVKGFLITLPVGGTGLITFPLGHEIGTHAEGRLPGDPHAYREVLSGAGIGVSVCLFVWLSSLVWGA